MFDASHDYSVMGARNETEALFYVESLASQGLIVLPGMRTASSTACTVTPSGWIEVDRIGKTGPQSFDAFIAMWFDKSQAEIEVAITKAVAKAGYNAVRVDRLQHLNRIDDEIIARIRQSRLRQLEQEHRTSRHRPKYSNSYPRIGIREALVGGNSMIYLAYKGARAAMQTTRQQRSSTRTIASGLIWAFLAALVVVTTPSAQAQTLTTLYNFTGGSDGGAPYGGLVMDAAANLYGTTSAGGTSNNGTVFKVTPAGQETVLYSFAGGTDGKNPYAGVILDSAGNLYGTTYQGGASNYGTVFKVTQGGNETILHSFAGGTTDGCNPGGGLIFDTQGNLYGNTQNCGASNYGTVFKVTSAGQESVLHSFAAGPNDGASPFYGSLLLYQNNLYGVTEHGGTGMGCNNNCGVLYTLTMSGTLTVLHSFANNPDGSFPFGTPIVDAAGNFFGTCESGGPDEVGIVWKVSPNGTETILHTFTFSTNDGASPSGGLLFGPGPSVIGSYLYGTTEGGGASGDGTIFQQTQNGQFMILHSFAGSDGEFPFDSVIRDAQGNLYGTASAGGRGSNGTVWKLAP